MKLITRASLLDSVAFLIARVIVIASANAQMKITYSTVQDISPSVQHTANVGHTYYVLQVEQQPKRQHWKRTKGPKKNRKFIWMHMVISIRTEKPKIYGFQT